MVTDVGGQLALAGRGLTAIELELCCQQACACWLTTWPMIRRTGVRTDLADQPDERDVTDPGVCVCVIIERFSVNSNSLMAFTSKLTYFTFMRFGW